MIGVKRLFEEIMLRQRTIKKARRTFFAALFSRHENR